VLENPGAEHFILFQIGLVRTQFRLRAVIASTKYASKQSCCASVFERQLVGSSGRRILALWGILLVPYSIG